MSDIATPLLAARGLCFVRDTRPVFGPLDFQVASGEALLIQGGNGAGKTTLLRVLAGLLEAEHGSVEIDGVPVARAMRAGTMAYLGHLPGLKADLDALQNLDFLAHLQGARRSQNAERALALVGLTAHAQLPVRQMSAGQKRRLSLARLWMSPARLWLLDEPYANLDLQGVDLVNRMVRAQLDDGGAALVTTHGAYAAPPVRTRALHLEPPA